MSRINITYILIWIISMSGLVSAAVNYSEYFPNWSAVLQSQSNGWATPVSSSKEIMTPEWCRNITSSQSSQKLIPTRTMNEWVSFRDHIPSGITINICTPTYSCPAWYLWSWISLDCYSLINTHWENEMCYIPWDGPYSCNTPDWLFHESGCSSCITWGAMIYGASSVTRPILNN